MSDSLEHILLVENDPEIIDLILRGSLQPVGYQVSHAENATEAIRAASQNNPDLIIVDLDLPDLSGKDLLVALAAQGIETPMIVLTKEEMESDIIQAFRLGASDYVCWPAKEAEILTAVERLLKQVRAKRDKDKLAKELGKRNLELQRRLQELKSILAINKTVTSTKRERELFEKVVEGAVYIAEADVGWLLFREDEGDDFILRAHMNLPSSYKSHMNNAWNENLSSLVAQSKEPLKIHGEPLKRFNLTQLGQAALVVPITIQNEVAGLITVMRKAANPFSHKNQTLLEAVADYASISLINVELIQALEERSRSLEKIAEEAKVSVHEKEAILRTIDQEVRGGMMVAVGYISMLVDGQMGELNDGQLNALRLSQDRLKEVVAILENQAID